eukprot:Gb_09157 [translate_table: standard]
MPILAYDVSLAAEAVRLVALHPTLYTFPDTSHESNRRGGGGKEVQLVRLRPEQDADIIEKSRGSTETSVILHANSFHGATVPSNSRHAITTTPGADPSQGQRTELRQVEEAEERRRKKGKYKVDEDSPRSISKKPPQAYAKPTSTSGVHQVPIPSLPNYLTNMLRLEWPGSIPDNFVNLEYNDRWKVFEEGLDKEECELFNHEQWRPTFTANVINILVRDRFGRSRILSMGFPAKQGRLRNKHLKLSRKLSLLKNFAIPGWRTSPRMTPPTNNFKEIIPVKFRKGWNH